MVWGKVDGGISEVVEEGRRKRSREFKVDGKVRATPHMEHQSRHGRHQASHVTRPHLQPGHVDISRNGIDLGKFIIFEVMSSLIGVTEVSISCVYGFINVPVFVLPPVSSLGPLRSEV